MTTALRIFAAPDPARTGPPRRPHEAVPSFALGRIGITSMPTRVPADVDHQILAVLDVPRAIGETIDALFRRKEHALGDVFARLSALDARTLHRRLSSPSSDDRVATRFAALIAERRVRLLAFLADARRREATRK